MAKIDKFIIDDTTYEIVPEIAPLFNPATPYSVGDCVIHDAVLYKFTANHAAGAWTGNDVTAFEVGRELVRLGSGGAGSGITEDIKVALLACFEKVAWIDEDGQDYYDALYDALYPPIPATAISLNTNALSFATLNTTQSLTATLTPSDTTDTVSWLSSDNTVATVSNGVVTSVGYGTCTITATAGSVSATCSVTIAQATLSSISAVYTQSGTVYNTDSLDSLKTDLVVTATWSNSATSTVSSNDYTLSGNLSVGTSTITVSYGGKTDTFIVTVTVMPVNPFDGVSWNDGFRISGGSEYTGQNNYSTTDYVDVSDISDVTIELTSTSGNVSYVIAWYSSNNNSSYLSNKNDYINYNSSTYSPSATSEKPSTASYCRICTTRASVGGTQAFPYALGNLDINVTFEE